MFKIVSFRRSGLHYLASLLHRNFETGAANYDDLHYSHHKTPYGPYIHVHRQVFPVMVSLWRARTGLGVAKGVTFHEMLRAPWESLPRTNTSLMNVGEVRRPHFVEGTALEWWRRDVERFDADARLSVPYDDAVADPLRVLSNVEAAFNVKRRSSQPILERVGWWPSNEDVPVISDEDMALMQEVSRW